MSAPNKNTKGRIGDTYIDDETGKKYVCTFAFSDSFGADEYEWKLDSVVENESEKLPGGDFQKNNSVFIQQVPVEIDETPTTSHITTNATDIVRLNAADTDGETEVLHKPKHNSYSKQYKQNRN